MALPPVLVLALQDPIRLYSDRESLIAENQNLTFPTDLSDAYIHMRFSKYVRRSINRQAFYEPQNGIRLPIPSKLNDRLGMNYSTDNLGPAYGAAAEAASAVGNINLARPDNLATSLLGGTGIGAGINAIAGVGASAIQRALEAAPRVLGGSALNTVSAVSGIAINQYQTTTFKTPEFKTHSFSWKLIPNNRDESIMLERIIRTFKYSSSPSTSSSGAYFGYPEILEIKIFPNDEYLYKFKPCVVKSISVNYAPQGPSFYRGTGAPTAIEFGIELQEIELWTKADYVRDVNGYPQLVTGTVAATVASALGGTTVRPALTPTRINR